MVEVDDRISLSGISEIIRREKDPVIPDLTKSAAVVTGIDNMWFSRRYYKESRQNK